MKKYCLFTNDVETTSLWNHCLSDKTGEKVLKEGMPILLNLYKKYNVRSTFFFTGYIAKKFPEIVSMVIPDGHEVGCHGLNHHVDQAFDILSSREQVEHLKKAKEILEDISQQEVISFRAPALRVNQHTPYALKETGFLVDSSVAPQRLDFFLSFGIKNKINWLKAPRKPFYTSQNNLARKGVFPLFEIPVNAYLLPYIGTFMRIAPWITKKIRFLVNLESKIRMTTPVFIIHPNELIEEKLENEKIVRRAHNLLSYILADKMRYLLKLKNLGSKAIPLFEDQIKYFYQKKYCFVSVKEYYYKVASNNEEI